jgi:hypothetical protein
MLVSVVHVLLPMPLEVKVRLLASIAPADCRHRTLGGVKSVNAESVLSITGRFGEFERRISGFRIGVAAHKQARCVTLTRPLRLRNRDC